MSDKSPFPLTEIPREHLDSSAETEEAGFTAVLDDRTREIIERRRSSRFKRRGWLVRRLLLLADIVGLTLAFLLGELAIGRGASSAHTLGSWSELLFFVVFLPVWVVIAKLYGLYDHDEERADHSTVNELVSVFMLVTLFVWVYAVGFSVVSEVGANVPRLALFWAAAVPLVTLGRVAMRAIARRNLVYMQNTLIVGAGDVGQVIARKMLNHPEYGINVVGFLDDRPRERHDDLDHLTLLGSQEQIRDAIASCGIERVIVAFSNDSDEQLIQLVRSIDDLDVQVDIVPRLFDIVGRAFDVHSVEGLPLLGLRRPSLPSSSMLLKRSFDLVLATIGLVLLALPLALVAVVIKLDSRGPVFFRQARAGTNGNTFRIYKFRTMSADADALKTEVADLNKHARRGGDTRMFKIADDPRVTRIGRLLRRFSLDELPQLINVVKGEMSLVGPRPLIPEEDRHVQEWARKRLDIKPGITGPWQVLGRSDIPFGEMIQLDYTYVTQWSLAEDLKLILRTLPAMARQRDAY